MKNVSENSDEVKRKTIIARVSPNNVERFLLAPDKQDINGSDDDGHQQSFIIACVLTTTVPLSASLKCVDSADYAVDLELTCFFGSIKGNGTIKKLSTLLN